VIGLQNHTDSPYIRGLGFMYVRYTQAPQDLYDWFEEYLEDEEEIDVKAGGGCKMTIGQMLKSWLIRLEWFDTLFPRIPVPIQNDINARLREKFGDYNQMNNVRQSIVKRTPPPDVHEAIEKSSRSRTRSKSHDRYRSRSGSRDRHRHHYHHSKHSKRHKSRSRSKSKDKRELNHHRRDKSSDKHRRSRSNSRNNRKKRRSDS
jgi:pre-mRNA-splicing factor 38B